MSLYFKTIETHFNNSISVAYEEDTAITTPSLCYRQGNDTHYVPLILPNGECFNKKRTVRYYYNPHSENTIHVRYKGKEYVVPNIKADISNIPSGTYVGQSAFQLFYNFISYNNFRVLKRSATIEHYGITKTFPAGTAVWLTYAYGGDTINLTFTQNKNSMPETEPMGSNFKEWWYPECNTAPSIQLHNGFTKVWSGNSFTLKDGVLFI